MAVKYLGQPFDIHCGGIDHIPVHHTNEIAQSEAAFEKPLANYWMHGEFLVINDGDKMAKSGGNFITLKTLKEKGISPLAYRYFCLQTHYRKPLTFSWEALQAAQNGLEHLYNSASVIPSEPSRTTPARLRREGSLSHTPLCNQFLFAINSDLDTPAALALVWQALKDRSITQEQLFKFDEVLGLKIKEHIQTAAAPIPEEVQLLVAERNAARANKDWVKSDELRKKLEEMGYEVKDTKEGTKIQKC
jgi:cysteinyl-tRNA synthetase